MFDMIFLPLQRLPLNSWVARTKSGQWEANCVEAFLVLEFFGSFCFKTKMSVKKIEDLSLPFEIREVLPLQMLMQEVI